MQLSIVITFTAKRDRENIIDYKTRFFVWHMPLTTRVPTCIWQWIIAYNHQSTKPPQSFLPFPLWSRHSSGLVVRNTCAEFHSCRWTCLSRIFVVCRCVEIWVCIADAFEPTFLLQDSQNNWTATIFKKWVGNSSDAFSCVRFEIYPSSSILFLLDSPLPSILRSNFTGMVLPSDETWNFEQKSVVLLSWCS